MILGKARATTPTLVRRRLSSNDFEKICREAAQRSTNCREYICSVLTGLCFWLDIPDGSDAFRNECEHEDGNLQRVILELYQLLEKNCLYDFDVLAVLNSYSANEP
jgi:hypothetical protein